MSVLIKNMVFIIAVLLPYANYCQKDSIEFIDTVIDEVEFPDFEDSGFFNQGLVGSQRKLENGNTAVLFYEDVEYVKGVYKNSGKYKYGFIKNGKQILPVIFDWKSYTYDKKKKENKIILQLTNKYGLYNLDSGNWDIPLIYESLIKLKDNTYLVKNNTYFIVDSENKILLNFGWETAGITKINNKQFLIVSHGKNQGVYDLDNDRYTIPLKRWSIERYHNYDKFKVGNVNNKYNLTNTDGELLLKDWYKKFDPINRKPNFIIVEKDKMMGVIDYNGNLIIPIIYRFIGSSILKDGSLLAQNNKGKYGFININGKISLPFEYDNIKTTYSAYSTKVKTSIKNNKYGIIRINNGSPYIVAKNEYNSIVVESNYCIVEKDKKFGIMDFEGKLLAPIEYESIYTYYDLLIAKYKGKSRISNKRKGAILSEKQFDDIKILPYNFEKHSRSNYMSVEVNNKVGLIDAKENGKEVAPIIFDEIVEISNQKFIIVKRDNKYGVYNIETDSIVIDSIYEQLIFDHKGGAEYYGIKNDEIFSITFNMKGENLKIIKL